MVWGCQSPRAPRRSGLRSSPLWCSQPSLLSRRKSLLWPAGHIQARLPQPPLLLHHLPLQALLYSLFPSKQPVGLPPAIALPHHLCCWASTHPAGLSLESFASSTEALTPPLGCLPCSDSTVSRPAAILRPTLQLQSFVGRTGGLLVCLVCSMPSPPAAPIFSSVWAEVGSTFVCPQPPDRSGRQSQELWAEATQDDFPEANRSSFPASHPT